MNNTMQAVWISAFGGPEVLEIRTVGKPLFNDDHVWSAFAHLRSTAPICSSARANIRPRPDFPLKFPAWSLPAKLLKVGTSVRLWKPGQRVFGLTGGGAHAEYVVTYENLLAEIPANLDWARLPPFLKSLSPPMTLCGPKLIFALAKRCWSMPWAAAWAWPPCNLPARFKLCPMELRRHHGQIDQASHWAWKPAFSLRDNFDDLATAAEKWTAGKGINVLLDLVGGPYVKASQKAMAYRGRMILVGTVAGGSYELDAKYVMSKRLQIRGTVLRARVTGRKNCRHAPLRRRGRSAARPRCASPQRR